MATQRWAAFLRGVNVGGRRPVVMAELRREIVRAGADAVRTHIQSGNLLVDVDDGLAAAAGDVERLVSAATLAVAGLDVPVRARTVDDLARIVASHPDAGAEVPDTFLHVILLDRVVDAARRPDPDRHGPDRLHVDGSELYATYPGGAGRSKLTLDLIERSFGASGTARNLSTLAKVVELGRAGDL